MSHSPSSTRASSVAFDASIQPYVDRTDVDLPWIGRLPEHWKVCRAKYLFREMDRPIRESDDVITAFRDGTVTLRRNRRTEGYTFSAKELGYQGIREGDLVIHSMDVFAGAAGVSDSDGKGSPVYIVCRPEKKLDVRYYAYLLRHLASSGYISALGQGIRQRSVDFRMSTFAEMPLPWFHLEEQQRIADYLDERTQTIDDLVARKERLIELLEEKRTVLITQAVTKGLDPDVSMKDSGLEWVGEIPKHWRLTRLKFLLSRVTSGSRDWGSRYSDDGPLFIRVGNLSKSRPELSTSDVAHVRPPCGVEADRSRIRPGDVLFSITADIGAVGVASSDLGEAYVNQHIALTSPEKSATASRWIAYWFLSHSGKQELRLPVYGGTKDGLALSDIKNLCIALPPREEQIRVANWLDRSTGDIDRLIRGLELSQKYLREYRSALITAAVTGKIDVRDHAA